MGGERETIGSQKIETQTGTEIIGSVRYHESKGQIHFHDDKNKLKVAVPVAVWYKAWNSLLSSVPGEWNYADIDNGTIMHVSVSLKKASEKKNRPHPRIDVLMQIQKVELSEDFSKLNNFSLK